MPSPSERLIAGLRKNGADAQDSPQPASHSLWTLCSRLSGTLLVGLELPRTLLTKTTCHLCWAVRSWTSEPVVSDDAC